GTARSSHTNDKLTPDCTCLTSMTYNNEFTKRNEDSVMSRSASSAASIPRVSIIVLFFGNLGSELLISKLLIESLSLQKSLIISISYGSLYSTGDSCAK